MGDSRIPRPADGEADPEAVWPLVRAQVTIDRSRGDDPSDGSPALDAESAAAQTAERVARRALALTAVGARALLEQPHDKLVNPHALLASMNVLDAPAAKALLAHPSLRPRLEIGVVRARLFALHWRLTNFRIRPSAIGFSEFARIAWFGPLDIAGLPLVEHDLAIAEERIDRADPEELAKANSAAHERHLAINWLWAGPQQYSQVRTDT